MLETTTGVKYDMQLIGEFCKSRSIFLVVDGISSFLADAIDMKRMAIDVLITGSQKALAVPPGVSILVLSERAISRIDKVNVRCLYLNLKMALKNGERGQTPFTPAVGTLIQINKRLKQIELQGVMGENQKTEALAKDFKKRIANLPLNITTRFLSNALKPLHPLRVSATDVFRVLEKDYGIWVCPNGGDLAETVFRVGHIGALTIEDNKLLVAAMQDMVERGLL